MSEVKTRKGLVNTKKLFKSGGEIVKIDEESESIDLITPEPGARMAEVGYDARITINLGNYESAQVGVSVRLPAYVEELQDAFEAAKKFVDEKLNESTADIREYRDSRE